MIAIILYTVRFAPPGWERPDLLLIKTNSGKSPSPGKSTKSTALLGQVGSLLVLYKVQRAMAVCGVQDFALIGVLRGV